MDRLVKNNKSRKEKVLCRLSREHLDSTAVEKNILIAKMAIDAFADDEFYEFRSQDKRIKNIIPYRQK